MFRRALGVGLVIALMTAISPAQAATAKPGGACVKKSAKVVISGSTYTCTATKGRLTWASTPTKAELARESALRNAQVSAGEFVTIPDRLKRPLEAWSGSDISGASWSTSSLAASGKVSVINIWASWCGPCKQEWPVLQAAAAAHPEVRFIGVNSQDRLDAAKAWLVANPSPYLHVFDERGVIKASLTTVPNYALPITIVLDKQGRVSAWITGAIKIEPLEKVLKQF